MVVVLFRCNFTQIQNERGIIINQETNILNVVLYRSGNKANGYLEHTLFVQILTKFALG